MIWLDLFLGFLRVGCFAFGGAYSAIPLIRDVVFSYGWLGDEALTAMIAVAESTPGPIMVNLATYVGSSQAGLGGAVLATLAVVLPSFVVILLAAAAIATFFQKPAAQAVLRGVKPCIIGVILATGVMMTMKSFYSAGAFDGRALLIAVLLAALAFASPPKLKKRLSPIALIVIAAVLGVVLS